MGGFVDPLRMVMGWWSGGTSTVPVSDYITGRITVQPLVSGTATVQPLVSGRIVVNQR